METNKVTWLQHSVKKRESLILAPVTVALKTAVVGCDCINYTKGLIVLETAFILLSKMRIENQFVSSNEQLGTAQYYLI